MFTEGLIAFFIWWFQKGGRKRGVCKQYGLLLDGCNKYEDIAQCLISTWLPVHRGGNDAAGPWLASHFSVSLTCWELLSIPAHLLLTKLSITLLLVRQQLTLTQLSQPWAQYQIAASRKELPHFQSILHPICCPPTQISALTPHSRISVPWSCDLVWRQQAYLLLDPLAMALNLMLHLLGASLGIKELHLKTILYKTFQCRWNTVMLSTTLGHCKEDGGWFMGSPSWMQACALASLCTARSTNHHLNDQVICLVILVKHSNLDGNPFSLV